MPLCKFPKLIFNTPKSEKNSDFRISEWASDSEYNFILNMNVGNVGLSRLFLSFNPSNHFLFLSHSLSLSFIGFFQMATSVNLNLIGYNYPVFPMSTLQVLYSERYQKLRYDSLVPLFKFYILSNAAIIPVSFCTSFGFRGGCKLLMALILSGFTSIPLWVTMYPRNFPDPTPKEHLDAFKRNLCLLRISKMFIRSVRCSDTNLLFTTISSI